MTKWTTKDENGEYPIRKILDHGEIQLIDVMGTDQAIVQAARVSTKNAKKTSDDRALIRYLMKHHHTTPFEMVEVKIREKMPIIAARQKVRHRTANLNEASARYGVMKDEFYIPDALHINWQAPKNKQGRSDSGPGPLLAENMQEAWEEQGNRAFQLYNALLGTENTISNDLYAEDVIECRENGGVAREIARLGLPLSTYTEWYWKCDLHNIFNFLRLRTDPHAQYEIRVYADALADIVKELFPIAYEAFEDYTLNAVTFSAPEMKLLGEWLPKMLKAPVEEIVGAISPEMNVPGLSKREIEDFVVKLRKMGGVQ